MSKDKDNYGYDESFQQRLLAAVVRKPREMKGLVEADYFSSPVHMDIAGLVLQVAQMHDTKETVLTKGGLLSMTKALLGGKRKELWPLYKRSIRKLFKIHLSDLPLLQKEALSFAKNVKFRAALIACEKDVSNRKYENVFRRVNELKKLGFANQEGLRFWKGHKDSTRWKEDRTGVVPSSYFPLLDKSMGGGIGAGELAIIQASGKAGKSSMLGRIAAGAMSKSFRVAIASGELSEFKYRKRIDSMLTGIAYTDLYRRRNEKTGTKKQMDMLRKFCKGDVAIKEFPSGRAKIQDVENWITMLEDSDFKPDLLIVDYLALFKSNEHYEERRINLGQAAVDLRGLAMEKKIGVWTAAQVNRAGLDKPMLGPSDLAEDISTFFTLDFLVALCQTAAERGTAEEQKEKKKQKGRLVLVSARDVSSGAIISLDIDRDTFSMRETGYWKGEKRGGR